MGHHRHHTLVVTSWDMDDLGEAHAKAGEIYARHLGEARGDGIGPHPVPVGPLIHGGSNGYMTFTVVLDGSKEGWATSNRSNEARAEFVEWLRKMTQSPVGKERRLFIDWVEVEFGGDDPQFTKLLAHNGDEEWRQT